MAKPVQQATKPEKFAPHSVEGEEATLGSILINPDGAAQIFAIVTKLDFFLVKNSWVFEAIKAVHDRGDDIDTLTVSQELRQRNQLEAVGGAAYILYLSDNTPTHIHAETYAQIVARAAFRRRILATCSDMAAAALQEDVELDDVLSYCKTEFSRLLSVGTKRYGVTIKQLASANMDTWEERQTQGGGIIGLPSGSGQLDVLCGGLLPDRLTVFGGRPKMGKTAAQLAVLLNVARHLHKTGKRGWCYLFSLEMGKDDIMQRLISAATLIPLNKLSLGRLTDEENACYLAALAELSDLRIFIDDTAGLSIRAISDRLEIYSLRYGTPALVAVDYLQRVRGTGEKTGRSDDNRATQIEDVAYGLSELSKAYHCHFLSGAQVKQEVDKRSDHRPTASDLAESDGILRASAHVVLTYRPGVYAHNDKSPDLEWIVGANRHGETGTAKDMRWRATCASVETVNQPIGV